MHARSYQHQRRLRRPDWQQGRTNIVLDRLRQAGTDEERLKKVHAPIGLDIGAVTPEEVALAILAEIVARHGGEAAARFRLAKALKTLDLGSGYAAVHCGKAAPYRLSFIVSRGCASDRRSRRCLILL